MLKNFHPVIVSGPSGAGKDAAIKRLIEKRPEIHDAVGYTTRQLREGEINGVDISIITKEKFDEMVLNNQLIEHAEFAGNYYGMPISEVEKARDQLTIFNVGISAAEAIKRYDNESITILIMPQSKEELLRRLGNRGFERFERAQSDVMYAASFFDYVVKSESNKLDELVSNIESIIYYKSDAFKIEYFQKFLETFFD